MLRYPNQQDYSFSITFWFPMVPLSISICKGNKLRSEINNPKLLNKTLVIGFELNSKTSSRTSCFVKSSHLRNITDIIKDNECRTHNVTN